MELFGKSLVISDFPARPDLTGIGLSDWEGYAARLTAKLNYTNTYYHQEPLMDITNIGHVPQEYDFLISTEVFEHICPPISVAFENARKLLKPGGFMIFTVPYIQGKTAEHFPDVRKFSVQQEGDAWTLIGTAADGTIKKFTNLTFHGGPGTVVEFRLFGQDDLLRDCNAAGFHDVRIHSETVLEFGIVWNPYIAEDAPYRPLIHGLDTPPWVLFSDPKND